MEEKHYCRICGQEVEPSAPYLLTIKQKKPGGTMYMHFMCYYEEQEEAKRDDRKQVD